MNRTELGCPKPCAMHEYSLTKSNLGTNTNVHKGKTAIWPTYNLPRIKIEEEYELMDVGAIIAAAGGSLSLFLGLSCYGFVWHVFERLEVSYQSRSSKPSNAGRPSIGAKSKKVKFPMDVQDEAPGYGAMYGERFQAK